MRPLLLALALAATPAVAPLAAVVQPSAPPSADSTPRPRHAVTATLLSVVLPGAGHLYAREPRRGAALLATYAAGVALGLGGENAVTPAGLVLVALPWTFGVIDAPRAVRRDARRQAARLTVAPWTGPAPTRPRPGLMLRLAR